MMGAFIPTRRPPPLENEIRHAAANTQSAAQAAAYLRVSYNTLKKYATLYGIWDTLKYTPEKGALTKNYATAGHPLLEILGTDENPQGKYPKYERWLLKNRLIRAKLLEARCYRCSFNEERVIDKRMPLRLVYKNGKLEDIRLSNLQLLCYNCYFLTVKKVGMRPERSVSPFGANHDQDLLDAHGMTLEDMKNLVETIKAEDLEQEEEYTGLCPHGQRWANCDTCYIDATQELE